MSESLAGTRFRLHRHCVVCGDRHPFGLKADFRPTAPHRVEARFGCGKSYEGYADILHGGVVSSLLDGAMANCLMAEGLEAYTVDLRIRFRAPVEAGVEATIKGEWLRKEGPLHLLQAALFQDGKVKATARGKFMEGKPAHPAASLPGPDRLRPLLHLGRRQPRPE